MKQDAPSATPQLPQSGAVRLRRSIVAGAAALMTTVAAVLPTALPAASAAAAEPAAYLDRRLDVEGVGMHLRLSPAAADPGAAGTAEASPAASRPTMGEELRLQVSVRRLADGQPLSSLPIGVWLDREVSPMSGAVPVCRQRIAGFLGGGLLTRPLLDLTGYWVLTLDREGSVSVLDPTVSFAGRSSLYKAVQLGVQPFDWLKTPDDARLFVALPGRREVAMLDLQSLSLQARVALEGRPTRLGLQPDGRLLWAALRGDDPRVPGADQGQGAPSREGLAAIDAHDGRVLHRVALPAGHHELAFSEDSRLLYVTSRDSGRMTVVETASGRIRSEVELGGQPLSLLALPGRDAVWAVDGAQGIVHRFDGEGRQRDRIALDPGLGPARLSPDGRHVLLVNPVQHKLYVLDAASGEALSATTISGRPYDVMFSELYVYVRSLDSDQVALFAQAQLPNPQLQYIAAGTAPVSAMPELTVASTMTPNFERSGAFFVVPSERTIYHYMEGMNAPDSSLRAFGHTPLAVTVAQRGLREVGRGEYAATFRVPSSGRMVLALAADAPQIRECVGVRVEAPKDDRAVADIRVRWLDDTATAADTGAPLQLSFMAERADGSPIAGLAFSARVVPGRGGIGERWPVAPGQRPGEYRIAGHLAQAGGYFVHVEPDDPALHLDPATVPAAVLVDRAAAQARP